HKAEHAFEGVGALLGEEGLTVACTSDYAALDAVALADKQLLVILRDGIDWPDGPQGKPSPWMQPEQEAAIEAFVLRGGAFLALHNAGWAYPWRGGYRRTLGGYYVGHPPMAEFTVQVVNTTHPVTAGVQTYQITDEQHILHWDFDRVTPLLVSQGQDGRGSVSGWAYDYGRGRVVYLPHGHTLEIIRHPSNLRLMRNAVRWLLRRG
ncbi:MAG: ThuA domain-containing protein, partial [Chloroflexota bacterium]